MGVSQLFFNHIATLSTLNRVLLGSAAFMVRSMGSKIHFDATAIHRAGLPVSGLILAPHIASSMRTGRNSSTGRQHCAAAIADFITGVSIYLVLMICLGLANQRSAAGMVIGILIALEGVVRIALQIAADSAGIEIHGLVSASTCFGHRVFALDLSRIIMQSKSAILSTASITNGQLGTGCGSAGVDSSCGTKGDRIDFRSLSIKQLVAVQTNLVCIVAGSGAGCFLSLYGLRIPVCTQNGNHTLSGVFAVHSNRGNRYGTGTHSKDTHIIGICDGIIAGNKIILLVGRIRGSDGSRQITVLALHNGQSILVQGNAGNRNRLLLFLALDGHAAVDNLKADIVVVDVVHIFRIISNCNGISTGSSILCNRKGQLSKVHITVGIGHEVQPVQNHRAIVILRRLRHATQGGIVLHSRQGQVGIIGGHQLCRCQTGVVIDPDGNLHGVTCLSSHGVHPEGGRVGRIDGQCIQQQRCQQHKRQNFLLHIQSSPYLQGWLPEESPHPAPGNNLILNTYSPKKDRLPLRIILQYILYENSLVCQAESDNPVQGTCTGSEITKSLHPSRRGTGTAKMRPYYSVCCHRSHPAQSGSLPHSSRTDTGTSRMRPCYSPCRHR